jgi:immunoglobulin-binding protein 1
MSNEDQSIRGLFAKAERAREGLGESFEPNSPTYQENLEKTIATYIQCLKKTEDFSLFSPNETLEDISSSDIQYMAISYHLAELIQKVFTPEVSSRKEHLLQARARYELFLKLLDSHDMLSKGDAKLFESYNDDKQNFSTVSTKDAAARRDVKIARFREEKELKRKLEVGLTSATSQAITNTYL